MDPNKTNNDHETTPQNVEGAPQTAQNPAPSMQQSVNSTDPKQVNYMAVFKNPVVLSVIGLAAVLFIIGLFQNNEDARIFFSIPLFALTPIVVGIFIIKQAKK